MARKMRKLIFFPLSCLFLVAIFFSITLPVYSDTGQSAPTVLEKLNVGQGKFLSPEKAFQISAFFDSKDEVDVRFRIADGYYLYRDKITFSFNDTDLDPSFFTLPPGIIKTDQYFGTVETYQKDFRLRLTANKKIDFGAGPAILKVGFQGCASAGLCYPPMFQNINIGPEDASAQFIPKHQTIASLIADSGMLVTIFSFIGFGLLLTFTPCVLPMVPILSSLIVGEGASTGTKKALYMSLVYVFAMCITYTVIGVMVGLTGESIQASLQNIWAILFFSMILIFLALSMFGFYRIEIPNFFQNKFVSLSAKNQKTQSYLSVFFMGVLSALIVSPCVTAPLIGALIYIANTQDPIFGGLALFSLSFGMGIPLLVIGTTASKWLPKSGAWMVQVERFFGFLLLGLVIWLLDRVLSSEFIMLLTALLFFSIAVWARVATIAGSISITLGVLILLSVFTGGKSLFAPLEGSSLSQYLSKESTSYESVQFKHVSSLQDLQLHMSKSDTQDGIFLFDIYADWCVTCKEIEAFVFTRDDVKNEMSKFELLRADVTAYNDADQKLLRSLQLFGPPAMLFYNKDGVELSEYRIVGDISGNEFIDHLQLISRKNN